MKTVGKEAENMGGIVRIWAIPVLEIELNGNSVSVNNLDNVFELQISQDSSGMTIEQKTDFGGTTFSNEITGFIAGYDSYTENFIYEMIRIKKFVVVCQDSQGNYIMAGRPKIPLRFNAGFNTGQASASRRGFEIQFKGNNHYNPLRLSESPFA